MGAREARENFEHAGLDHIIDSRINDALKEIPALEGTFDFVFIDNDFQDMKGVKSWH